MKLPSFIFKAAFASGIAALTIGALPAQAGVIGTLGWSDTTTDFYDDAVDGSGSFTVEFSSAAVGGQAAVGIANGIFVPPFKVAPPLSLVNILNDPTGMFTGGVPAIAPSLYKLTNDLVFEFNPSADKTAEAIVSLLGSKQTITFLGEKNLSDALEFELEEGNWFVQLDKDNDGTYETEFFNTSSVLEFGQTAGSSFGVYDAEDTVHVPGPLPLLGAGMAFGFSRKLRSRIKARAQA